MGNLQPIREGGLTLNSGIVQAKYWQSLQPSFEQIQCQQNNKTNGPMDTLTETNYDLDSAKFYHGTKANLKLGDFIEAGFHSNYGQRKKAKYIYLTATLDAAVWGAELAGGKGPGRIYIVEPTGPIEDDPNLTDKKFKGNPTKSYRSLHALKVVGEITEWQGHAPGQLKAKRDHLEQLRQQGIEAIED